MKSFKHYLFESKKIYEFKLKIVGDHTKDDAPEKIKSALVQYNATRVSSKSTPIQETQVDFPDQKNVAITIFDITTDYPATNDQISSAVSAALSTPIANIRVRNTHEEAEEIYNKQFSEKSGKALLGTDYKDECNQSIAGEQQKMSFLASLKNLELDQYTGVNDELFPQKPHSEKANIQCSKPTESNSVVGSRKIEKPTAAKTGKK